MTLKIARFSSVLLPILLWSASPDALSRELYRYINDEGVTEVGYQVPPQHIQKGYQVLNERGVVLREVPRELTAQEQKLADAQQRLDIETRAEEERLQKWDESLLMRYSSIEDVEAAKKRGLSNLQIRVSILKSNKRSLKQQIENYQAQAAEQERLGKKVDETRLSAIAELQSEIQITDRAISDRTREIEAVSSAYDEDIERFSMLLDLVEFRRSRASQEEKPQADPRS